jgi:hypothetical protein
MHKHNANWSGRWQKENLGSVEGREINVTSIEKGGKNVPVLHPMHQYFSSV